MRSTATQCTGTPSLRRCEGIDKAGQVAIVTSRTDHGLRESTQPRHGFLPRAQREGADLGERLAGLPVAVAVEAVRISGWAAGRLVERLGLGLGGEVAAVPIGSPSGCGLPRTFTGGG